MKHRIARFLGELAEELGWEGAGHAAPAESWETRTQDARAFDVLSADVGRLRESVKHLTAEVAHLRAQIARLRPLPVPLDTAPPERWSAGATVVNISGDGAALDAFPAEPKAGGRHA